MSSCTTLKTNNTNIAIYKTKLKSLSLLTDEMVLKVINNSQRIEIKSKRSFNTVVLQEDYYYFVLDGKVNIIQIDKVSDNYFLTDTVPQGYPLFGIDEFLDKPKQLRIAAMCNSVILKIPSKLFKDLIKITSFYNEVLDQLSKAHTRLKRSLVLHSQYDVRQKIMFYLLDNVTGADKDGNLISTVTTSNQFTAYALSSSREMISKIFTELTSEGKIKKLNNDTVIIFKNKCLSDLELHKLYLNNFN